MPLVQPYEQVVCTKEYKQGQISNEQSFMKSEFSLFTQTTIQTDCLLKNYFEKDTPLLPEISKR